MFPLKTIIISEHKEVIRLLTALLLPELPHHEATLI